MKSGLPPAEVARSLVSLCLPWPPSVNGYKMPVKMGARLVMVLTPRAREYRLEVAQAIGKQLGHRRPTTYRTPVQLDLELRAPDKRVRDISNHVKCAEDSLVAAGILEDDSLVDVLVVRRGRLLKGGCVNVLIAPLDREPELDPTDSTDISDLI